MKKFLSILLCAVLFVGSAAIGTAAEGDIVYGNVDGSPGITSGDARIVLRYSVGLEDLNEDQLLAADVDGNGVVNAGDARMILRGSVGLEKTSEFGVNGSQVFMSGNFVMTATVDEESGTKFTISQTENSSYMEATMDIDMSDGSTNTGKPVRIGFMTVGEKVYWVLPDADPMCYLLIDEKVTENMGIDADLFKELIPQIMSPQVGRTPDEQTAITINGKSYNRWIYENEDGTSIAHDMRGITLQYLRTFDADGNETSCMRVNSILPTVPAYQQGLPSGSILYAAKEGDAEDNIGYITAFLMRFAALANIPTDDLLN
ncbi:MAG: hypothetical protein E7523_06060 [Ruminococcaceae bacterium]|nr:hypothetical protein [Oscillospiraceae bacterium]